MTRALITYVDPDDPPWTAAHRPAVDALRAQDAIAREIARSTRPRVNCARPVTLAEYWNRHDTTETTL